MNMRFRQLTMAVVAAGFAGSVAASGGDTLAQQQYQDPGQQQQQQAPRGQQQGPGGGGGAPQQQQGAPQQQQGAPQQQAPGAAPGGEAADVSSEELDKFAAAHDKVEQIREEYMEDAGDASDPDAMADIQMSMQQEMVEVVESEGLDVGTYNRIAQMLPYDDELRERLEDRL